MYTICILCIHCIGFVNCHLVLGIMTKSVPIKNPHVSVWWAHSYPWGHQRIDWHGGNSSSRFWTSRLDQYVSFAIWSMASLIFPRSGHQHNFRCVFTMTGLNKAQIMVSLFLCSFGSDVLSGDKVSEGLFHRHRHSQEWRQWRAINLSLMQILKWLFSDKMPAESSCVRETG